MKILVVSSGMPPAYLGGGPIQTLSAMLASTPDSHSPYVITNNFDLNSNAPLVDNPNEWISYMGTPIMYVSSSVFHYVRSIFSIVKLKPDVAYLNSFFDVRMSIVMQILFAFSNSKIAIAPRGQFDPGAMEQKSAKKRIYLAVFGLFKRFYKSDKFVWHASSEREAENIRRTIGPKTTIIIRENDTLLPLFAKAPLQGSGELNTVSLCRVSPKKGLHILLEGLARVTLPIRLDIIGPLEDAAYYRTCSELAHRLPAHVKVRFLGPRTHDQLRGLLAEYDLMTCPTKGENFGHVIAESLSVSCPVMCADVTPWSSWLQSGGGVLVKNHTAEGWRQELEAYLRVGRDSWFRRRLTAQNVYREWRSSNTSNHFFNLLEEAVHVADSNNMQIE